MVDEQGRTIDAGIGYKASYKDKKTGEDVSYLKISLRKAVLDELPLTARGTIDLTIFALTGPKKSERTPDFVIKPKLVAADHGTAAATPVAAVATGHKAGGGNFPF